MELAAALTQPKRTNMIAAPINVFFLKYYFSCTFTLDVGKRSLFKTLQIYYASFFKIELWIMVLILDVNSEKCAHARSILCYLISLRYLIRSWAATNRLFFFLKKSLLLPFMNNVFITCQTCRRGCQRRGHRLSCPPSPRMSRSTCSSVVKVISVRWDFFQTDFVPNNVLSI